MRGTYEKLVILAVWMASIVAACSLVAQAVGFFGHYPLLRTWPLLGSIPLSVAFFIIASSTVCALILEKLAPQLGDAIPRRREDPNIRDAHQIASAVLVLHRNGSLAIEQQITREIAALANAGVTVTVDAEADESKINLSTGWKSLRPSQARAVSRHLCELIGCYVAKKQPLITVVLDDISSYNKRLSALLQSARIVFEQVRQSLESVSELVVDVPIELVGALIDLGYFKMADRRKNIYATAGFRTVMQPDRRRSVG